MSILSKLFGGGDSPYGAAKPYLDQVPGIGHDTYDDYINKGKTAGGISQDMYDELTKDPTGFINRLMEGYKPSEGYQFSKNELTNEMSNTAAAGGVAGTPLDQMNQAKGVQGLLSKDQQQYLENILGAFNTGLKGEADTATRGFDASKGLGDVLTGNANQNANLGFQDAQQKNANRTAMIQMIAKALGAAGGFAFGGPAGGMAGASTGAGIAKNIFG